MGDRRRDTVDTLVAKNIRIFAKIVGCRRQSLAGHCHVIGLVGGDLRP